MQLPPELASAIFEWLDLCVAVVAAAAAAMPDYAGRRPEPRGRAAALLTNCNALRYMYSSGLQIDSHADRKWFANTGIGYNYSERRALVTLDAFTCEGCAAFPADTALPSLGSMLEAAQRRNPQQ
jgi:hypothetical protein